MTPTMWNFVEIHQDYVDVYLIDTSRDLPSDSENPLLDWSIRHGRWIIPEGLVQSLFDSPEDFVIGEGVEADILSTTGTYAAWGYWDQTPDFPLSGDERLMVAEISGLSSNNLELAWIDVVAFPTSVHDARAEVVFRTVFTQAPRPPVDRRPCRREARPWDIFDPCGPDHEFPAPSIEGEISFAGNTCYTVFDLCLTGAGFNYNASVLACKGAFVVAVSGAFLGCAAISGPGGFACAGAAAIGGISGRHYCMESASAARQGAEAGCRGAFFACCIAKGNCPLLATDDEEP